MRACKGRWKALDSGKKMEAAAESAPHASDSVPGIEGFDG